jgi:hypothetical protein
MKEIGGIIKCMEMVNSLIEKEINGRGNLLKEFSK